MDLLIIQERLKALEYNELKPVTDTLYHLPGDSVACRRPLCSYYLNGYVTVMSTNSVINLMSVVILGLHGARYLSSSDVCDKPWSEPVLIILLSHLCVTRPHSVICQQALIRPA